VRLDEGGNAVRRALVFSLLVVLFPGVTMAAESLSQPPAVSWCGTPSPTLESRPLLEGLRQASEYSWRTKALVRVPVAFHVLTDGKAGKLSKAHVGVLINNLNWAFRDSGFTFYLYRLDTTKSKGWYNNCVANPRNQQKIRKRLARDVRYYLNVYSCKLGVPGHWGQATFPPGFPGFPVLNFMQGVAVDPYALGSNEFPYGLVLAHEVGHYLGALHTFENALNPGQVPCADPGDFVADTPTQANGTLGSCPIGNDTCPALAGLDDVPNFMNYATDECMQHFTPGQVAWMQDAVRQLRPTLGTR
jgi:hypothetical protein